MTAVGAPAPEPGRSAGDILSRTVRLTLGGKEYVLPVLTIGGNRRWQAQLDRELGAILNALRKAGRNAPGVVEVLDGQVDKMLDLITSYDTTGVLPDRDTLIEQTYEAELIEAVQEVWLAANPLAAIGLRRLRMIAAPTSESSEPTSSPPPNGAGRPKRSKKN